MTQRTDDALLDFAALAGRLRRVLPVLVVAAVLGAASETAVAGWSSGVALRWATLLALTALVAVVVLVALQALHGADRAQRRGERLAGDDVGLLPSRRPDEREG